MQSAYAVKSTLKILSELKRAGKHHIRYLGKRLVVYPHVFSPAYFGDSLFFAKEIPIRRGEIILDVGTGTGILAIASVNKKAKKVVGVDFNPNAIINAKENIKIYGMEKKISIYKGNLFYPFRNEKFTTIVWNFPFCNTKAKSYLEKSVFDYQYKSLERFLKEAKKHLKKNGRIILGFSPDLGDEKLLKKIIHKKGYGQKLICEKKSTQSHVRGAQKRVRYQLFELRPN